MLEQMHEIGRADGRHKLGGVELIVGDTGNRKSGHARNVCVPVAMQLELDESDIYEASQFQELVPFAVDLFVKVAEREREVLVRADFGVVDIQVPHFGGPFAFVEAGEEPKWFDVLSEAHVE